MSTRIYKSGTRWCVWRWTFTPSGYITRLHLLKTPWFAIMLHFINSPDPEPHLHDHPVSFLSLILWGWYTEFYRTGRMQYRMVDRRWWNFISAWTRRHKIVAVAPHTITLCFVGPKVREWGFYTQQGWVHWRDYNRKYVEGIQ